MMMMMIWDSGRVDGKSHFAPSIEPNVGNNESPFPSHKFHISLPRIEGFFK